MQLHGLAGSGYFLRGRYKSLRDQDEDDVGYKVREDMKTDVAIVRYILLSPHNLAFRPTEIG